MREILDCDMRLEQSAMPVLREAIAHCETVRDYVSRELLEDILESEEEHVDFIETQIELIEQIGIQNYIQLQSEPAKIVGPQSARPRGATRSAAVDDDPHGAALVDHRAARRRRLGLRFAGATAPVQRLNHQLAGVESGFDARRGAGMDEAGHDWLTSCVVAGLLRDAISPIRRQA